MDLPVGTGRHAEFLVSEGHRVTAADLDHHLVNEARQRLARCNGIVLDATAALPFEEGAFDAVIIVDLVHASLLGDIGQCIRPGGWLIYESYKARGQNWRQLLAPGETRRLLSDHFSCRQLITRAVGPTGNEAETVLALAQRL